MSLSRRAFMRTGGIGRSPVSSALVAARGREAAEAEAPFSLLAPTVVVPPDLGEVRINSNENPLGPGKKAVEALMAEFGQTGRYPFNSRLTESALAKAIGERFKAKPENVVLGAGSGEILRNAVRAYTSARRPLVTAMPSFEAPSRTAEQIGTPVRAIPVDSKMRIDLDQMAEASKGAGLVFLCNPNNPTSTVHSAKAIEETVRRIRQSSPDAVILIDEAYHDYVTDPSYATAVPLALEHHNVFVARTFSKAYGMAGLRLGYAIGQAATLADLARYKLPYNANVLAIGAAMASIEDDPYITSERERNTKVRQYTLDFFKKAGFEGADSQTNFIFVNLKRPAKEVREACAKMRILIGRDFPPFEKTHMRISMGTMEEMERATQVFSQVLGLAPATAAARG